jgi:hypothetical protein
MKRYGPRVAQPNSGNGCAEWAASNRREFGLNHLPFYFQPEKTQLYQISLIAFR